MSVTQTARAIAPEIVSPSDESALPPTREAVAVAIPCDDLQGSLFEATEARQVEVSKNYSFFGMDGLLAHHHLDVTTPDGRELSELGSNDTVSITFLAPNVADLFEGKGNASVQSISHTRDMTVETLERLLGRLQGLEEFSFEYDYPELLNVARAFTGVFRAAAFSRDTATFLSTSGLGTFTLEPPGKA